MMIPLTQAPGLVSTSGRALPPRARALRPAPAALPPPKDSRGLASWRNGINRASLARSAGPMSVALYALTGPDGDPHADLATAQAYADTHRLIVADRIIDTVADYDQASTDNPEHRRGYSRAPHLLGTPGSPVHSPATNRTRMKGV